MSKEVSLLELAHVLSPSLTKFVVIITQVVAPTAQSVELDGLWAVMTHLYMGSVNE